MEINNLKNKNDKEELKANIRTSRGAFDWCSKEEFREGIKLAWIESLMNRAKKNKEEFSQDVDEALELVKGFHDKEMKKLAVEEILKTCVEEEMWEEIKKVGEFLSKISKKEIQKKKWQIKSGIIDGRATYRWE
jgi:histidinol dehydrogenase